MQAYHAIESTVRDAGFHCDFRSTEATGPRLVCATDGGDWGLGGTSFWVAQREDRWFISTWAPRIYEIPHRFEPGEVVVAALDATGVDCYDVPDGVKAEFQLSEIGEAEFDLLDR